MTARPVLMPSGGPLLITIDVEGDDAWSRRREASTRNAAFLPRFQELCESHGFVPTYLTNYEMASSPEFVAFGRAAMRAGKAEIGMHLHAWNSPPHFSLTEDDTRHCPYLIDYPSDILRRKVEHMTRFLEDIFSIRVVSHRAGRWALNADYVRVLAELGYTIDCSVTPHVDWSSHSGAPAGHGGSDYRSFPGQHYWIGGDDISRPVDSDLLEVPMTIVDSCPGALRPLACGVSGLSGLTERVVRRLWPLEWMRPNGRNLQSMLRILESAERERWPYVEFMLHSSELMPGGSPTFRDESAIERLYDDLAAVFAFAKSRFAGASLATFRESVRASGLSDSGAGAASLAVTRAAAFTGIAAG